MFSVTFIVFLCSPRFYLFLCSRLQCCFLVHWFFIIRVALSFVLGFFCISYIQLHCNFRVSSSLVALSPVYSLTFGVFARPSILSLPRYRLVSISFVAFAFLVCLIAFFQCVGCFILTLYLFRGNQREYSLKPLKYSINERILVFKLQIYAYFYPL